MFNKGRLRDALVSVFCFQISQLVKLREQCQSQIPSNINKASRGIQRSQCSQGRKGTRLSLRAIRPKIAQFPLELMQPPTRPNRQTPRHHNINEGSRTRAEEPSSCSRTINISIYSKSHSNPICQIAYLPAGMEHSHNMCIYPAAGWPKQSDRESALDSAHCAAAWTPSLPPASSLVQCHCWDCWMFNSLMLTDLECCGSLCRNIGANPRVVTIFTIFFRLR